MKCIFHASHNFGFHPRNLNRLSAGLEKKVWTLKMLQANSVDPDKNARMCMLI